MNTSLISFQTIVRKEVSRFLRIWPQTLLPSVITMTLYFMIFGNFIGSRIEGFQGYSYMNFIAPGIIMMAIIMNSYSNVVSSFFGSKFQRSIEEILVSPTPTWVIITAFCSGGMLRGLIVGVLVSLVALFFTQLVIFNLFIVLVYVLLTALVFSMLGLLNGIYATKFDDISIIPTFVLTPLTYLGGVFYSITLLPAFWQTVSKANPILYMVNGFRYGFLGISDISVGAGLGILVVFTIILYAVNHHLINKGVGLRS
ncbi:MAG: ABC transporter permease [Nanoarchaeota archaeon]